MDERMTLPVLPLRDFVLFPGVTAPINAGKPATLRAIEAALKTPDRLVFAVSQREDGRRSPPNRCTPSAPWPASASSSGDSRACSSSCTASIAASR